MTASQVSSESTSRTERALSRAALTVRRSEEWFFSSQVSQAWTFSPSAKPSSPWRSRKAASSPETTMAGSQAWRGSSSPSSARLRVTRQTRAADSARSR